jgi:hypothetical protein
MNNRLALFAGIVVCGASACASEDLAPTQVAPGERPAGLALSATRAQLRQQALAFAARSGAATAQLSMAAVAAGDHQAAATVISGDIVNEHQPVYVVVMTGATFTAPMHPPGVEAPRSNVLTITYDAATLRVTDFSYTMAAPDLKRIDSVDAVDLMRSE